MIKRIYLIIIIFGFCVACNKIEKPKKPDNLIAKEKMVDILFDVYVFNAAKVTNKRKLENNNVTPDVYIYKKHNIDSLQFVNSNEYYAFNINEYEDIIDKVETRIKTQKEKYQKEIDKEEAEKKKQRDSIKRAIDTLKPKKKVKKPIKAKQN
ncbi:DUF4296 domain-containing protein [Psychroserpens sp. S379A]|uniref:DUF4296 domain-containing protein n=1 Tax=Psychroserpens sp. S379A TaxID=3415137 RepID=UPI003C7CAC7D